MEEYGVGRLSQAMPEMPTRLATTNQSFYHHPQLVTGICILPVLLVVLAMIFPSAATNLAVFLPLDFGHELLEQLALLVSVLIVVISWHALDSTHARVANILIFSFTLIAAGNFLLLSAEHSSVSRTAEQAISDRVLLSLVVYTAKLIVVIGLSVGMTWRGSRNRWLVFSLIVLAGVGYFRTLNIELLRTSASIKQFLPIIRWYFGILSVVFLLASIPMALRCRRNGRCLDFDYAAAMFLWGVSGLALMFAPQNANLLNLLGHLCSFIAYSFVFHAAFMAGVRLPYIALEESEAELASKKMELESLLDNIPVTVMRIDKDFRYRYVSKLYEKRTGFSVNAMVGGGVKESTMALDAGKYIEFYNSALYGVRVEYDFDFVNCAGEHIFCSAIVVPERDVDGEIQGVLAIIVDVTERVYAQNLLAKSRQEIEHMAFHDALTGLPNRRLLLDRLRQAVARAARQEQYGAILLIDIDHFKEINDTLGHVLGDELLQHISARLRDSLRSSDTIGRLGGDEFVIILEDIGASIEEAIAHTDTVCAKIRAAAAIPCCLAEDEISATLTIGASLFRWLGDNSDELLKQADIALYKAKEEGRDRVRYFDPSLEEDVTARTELLRDLRQAVGQKQLQLYYQPIVDSDLRILGVEALLRWHHPVHGLIPPDIFIPLAEQSNLILGIGQWVLETACRQLRQWSADAILSEWSISVNVSARQLNDIEFVANVESALEQAGADPTLLCLELTESMLHHNLVATRAKMETLRARGVHFSLDDFGTGYSSLSYLKQLPIDQLKIDKSFIRDALSDDNSAAIVAIILSLAHNLDLRVVAEGVETSEQLSFLIDHGCTAFQGYLFARPLPIAELVNTIPELSRPA